jgi:hypothetical protein
LLSQINGRDTKSETFRVEAAVDLNFGQEVTSLVWFGRRMCVGLGGVAPENSIAGIRFVLVW